MFDQRKSLPAAAFALLAGWNVMVADKLARARSQCKNYFPAMPKVIDFLCVAVRLSYPLRGAMLQSDNRRFNHDRAGKPPSRSSRPAPGTTRSRCEVSGTALLGGGGAGVILGHRERRRPARFDRGSGARQSPGILAHCRDEQRAGPDGVDFRAGSQGSSAAAGHRRLSRAAKWAFPSASIWGPALRRPAG
jgi:hypothetical protein